VIDTPANAAQAMVTNLRPGCCMLLPPLTLLRDAAVSRSSTAMANSKSYPRSGGRTMPPATPMAQPRVSGLELLVLCDALHGRTLEHAILEGGVVLELGHRHLAADAPRIEDEAVGIEHGILVRKPLPP